MSYLIKNFITHWFVIIIGEEECENFGKKNAETLGKMKHSHPEDLTEQEITGFNDDDVQARVNSVDEMVRDADFQGVTRLLN